MSKTKWAAVGVAALACIGAFPAYGFVSQADDTAGTIRTLPTTAAPSETTATSGAPSPAASVLPSKRVSAAPSKTVSTAPTQRASTVPRNPVSVLSGKREVTIARVPSFESGLALLNGELAEVDDDSGRQLFVPTPLGADRYLIKAYGEPYQAGSDEPICWHVRSPYAVSETVEGAACNAKDKDQQFTITAHGKKEYAISNQGAYLQYFPTSGLILQELGDSPLVSTFRISDTGPTRNPHD